MATAQIAVANEILNQLGNIRFIAMTGAKNFVALENGLRFRLPSNFATSGINLVTIRLTAADDYSIEYGKLRGTNYKVIAEQDMVYADMLQRMFTKATGLDCHL